ncbi:hypothetical protein LTR85_011945 [Meristemomyces frigidus]|nr:hypothetical protein LTR85_011945 [Meristemomyces frigidus]
MAATDASNAVFHTTELLEGILVYLPIRDVLQAQRVSQRWYDVIASSKKMKPNLFLAARPCHEYLYWKRDKPNDREYSPFVTSEPLEGRACHKIVAPYPAFTWDAAAQDRTYISIDIDCEQLVSWEPGQWQDMLIMQPPCFEASVRYIDGFGDSTTVKDEHGITLGALRHFDMPRKAERDRLHATMLRRGANKKAALRMKLRVTVGGYVAKDAPYVAEAMSRLDGDRHVVLA